MNIEEYIEKMKIIQEEIFNFIINEENDEENYENLIKKINDLKIKSNRHDLKVFLYLIIKIANNHHRNYNFFMKIEQILYEVKDEIKKYFSNKEIFKIFKSNKRILLFLIEEQIITVDQTIYKEMVEDKYQKSKYIEYFSPEIKPFLEKQIKQREKINEEDESTEEEDYVIKVYEKIKEILKEDSKLFNEKRKKGENDGYLYKLIQTDSIEDFIIFINKKDYSLNICVQESIYETNPSNIQLFLDQFKYLNIYTTLIEYSAFFGSIQIFKYLYKNDVKLTPSLWIYAVHGENEEIFHILKENNIECKQIYSKLNQDYEEEDDEEEEEEIYEYDDNDIFYNDFLKEAIKCHHNYMVNYFKNNFMNEKDRVKDIDYYTIAQFLLNTKKINVNSKIILNIEYFYKNKIFLRIFITFSLDYFCGILFLLIYYI